MNILFLTIVYQIKILMNLNHNKSNRSNYILIISFVFHLKLLNSFCKSEDNYETLTLEGEEGNYLVDINDYNNLKLIVSTSKNIYSGIPLTYRATTGAKLNNCSSIATINQNYILASCLDDSLLSKININTGEYTSLVSYSDISSPTLNVPITICSLSVFNNIVFIGYTIMNTNNNNKTNIVIKINIANKEDSNGPILDTSNVIKIFKFPKTYFKTGSIRQIGCEAVNITNDKTNYRLICVYETMNSDGKYQVYGFTIKNNLDGVDTNDENNLLYGFDSASGFKLYKIDTYKVRCIMRKLCYDLYLKKSSNKINVEYTEGNSNLTSSKPILDLYDYNNNLIFTSNYKASGGKKIYSYLAINKATSTNIIKIYNYLEFEVLKLIGYYDETNDNIMVVSQFSTSIKSYIIKNSKNICEVGSYSSILKITTDKIIIYNIENLLAYYTNLNNINFLEIFTYEPASSKNISFLSFIHKDNDNTRIFYLSYPNFFIRSCKNDFGNPISNYNNCQNTYLENSENFKCFSINHNIKGYMYNPLTNTLDKCYKTCQFCSKNERNSSSSEHNCESCIDGYMPSFQYLGNCYQIDNNKINSIKKVNNINDNSFTLVDSCTYYKINSTGECVNKCPSSNIYYSFIYNYLNFNRLTNNKFRLENFNKVSIFPPKYLFNNICYESCPSFLNTDDINNKCICKFAFHKEGEIIICYEVDYCINNTYKYYLNDTKECISSNECPIGYFQFNFECYKNSCPPQTNEYPENSNKCISNYNYCYINKYFKNICSNTQNNEYKYKFNDTVQYLKSCDESIIYTTYETKTYLYNNTCYLSCPDNTIKNDISNTCVCQYFSFYKDNDNYICYSEEEKCKDKIPVIDIKTCLNSIKECREKNYKIFNNECYTKECPINTQLVPMDENNCICKYYYYNYSNNNTLDCFEESITCEENNYFYQNPNIFECYIDLNDCFSKGNFYYFNNFCYKNQCPNGKISLSSTNESIQNFFKEDLSLNENLKNKICICDIINTNINWNKTELNQIECLENCGKDYEPDLLTHKCTEKCNTNKHYNFNDKCYKEGCPIGTKLNISENTKKICICENLYYIDERNNQIVCFDENNITYSYSTEPINSGIYPTEITNVDIYTSEEVNTKLTNKKVYETELQSIEIIKKESTITISTLITEILTNIKKSNKTEIIYPEEYYNNPDNCLAVYENECYMHCPEGTCLTTNDINLVYCVPIESNMFTFNDICFVNFKEIIYNLKNISESGNHTIDIYPGITINIYTNKNALNYSMIYSNLSIIFLNECEELLLDYYNLTNDTILYIIGIDSPNKNKSYVINVYNYGVFLENGYQLDHLKVCKDAKITINSPIIDVYSIKIDKAKYFFSFGYDIYNINDSFYNKYCSPAYINGNDITLLDRKKDFYPLNSILCNNSCEYNYINFTSKKFICECDLNFNFTENNYKNKINDTEENISYKDYILSLINYKIITCYKLLTILNNYNNNIGFYIASGIIVICFIEMLVFITCGMKYLKEQILIGIPNKYKLKALIKKKNKMKKSTEKINFQKGQVKNEQEKNNINYYNFIYINNVKPNYPPIKKSSKYITNDNLKIKKRKKETSNETILKTRKRKNKNEKILNNTSKLFNLKNKKINIYDISNQNLKGSQMTSLISTISKKKLKLNINKYEELAIFSNDDSVDKKEINHIPYTQALRIDKRDCLQMFISILANEVKIISLFYYKNPYVHLSLSSSVYLFESLFDLTLNCFFFTDNYVSEKYRNGSLKIITSIMLSLISNIFSSIVTYLIIQLVEYTELLDMIMNNVIKRSFYYLNIIKFRKYIKIKLICFYIIETLFNLFMCYYLTIFCIVYNKTQGSILINYIIGIAESLIISIFISITTSFLRFISIKIKSKKIYNTSKYIYEKF